MYAQITTIELNRLATLKASGLCTQVYLALASHAWDKGVCFPSLKTISKALSHSYHIKSIERALRWLEKNLLIRRKEATSKSRFVMLLRKVKDKVLGNGGGGGNRTRVRSKEQNGSRKTRNDSYKITKKRRNITYSNTRFKKSINHSKEIGDWLLKMSDVQSMKDMRSNPQYSHLMKGMDISEAEYQYPPKPQGKQHNWKLSDVKKAFRDYGFGLAEKHWIFEYYLKNYEGVSIK